MANKFLGIKQSTLSDYNATSDEAKKGYLWLIRDKNEDGTVSSSAIYFGTRLYSQTNDNIDELFGNLIKSFGGLIDNEGNYVGFPYGGEGTSDEHPILSLESEDLLDVLKNLEGAIVENAEDIEETKEALEDAISGLTEQINNAIAELKDEIGTDIDTLWSFKGTKENLEELPSENNKNGDVYQVGDKEYAWNGSEWVELGFNIDLSGYYTKDDIDDIISGLTEEINNNFEQIENEIIEINSAITVTNSRIDAIEEQLEQDETHIITGNDIEE